MYKSYMKNALYLAVEAKQILSLGKHCPYPFFANVIKSKITSSIIYIFVCLLKTE